jgi:hypothetical protein
MTILSAKIQIETLCILVKCAAAKEYEAKWLQDAKTVLRDSTGRFAKKGGDNQQQSSEANDSDSDQVEVLPPQEAAKVISESLSKALRDEGMSDKQPLVDKVSKKASSFASLEEFYNSNMKELKESPDLALAAGMIATSVYAISVAIASRKVGAIKNIPLLAKHAKKAIEESVPATKAIQKSTEDLVKSIQSGEIFCDTIDELAKDESINKETFQGLKKLTTSLLEAVDSVNNVKPENLANPAPIMKALSSVRLTISKVDLHLKIRIAGLDNRNIAKAQDVATKIAKTGRKAIGDLISEIEEKAEVDLPALPEKAVENLLFFLYGVAGIKLSADAMAMSYKEYQKRIDAKEGTGS